MFMVAVVSFKVKMPYFIYPVLLKALLFSLLLIVIGCNQAPEIFKNENRTEN